MQDFKGKHSDLENDKNRRRSKRQHEDWWSWKLEVLCRASKAKQYYDMISSENE
jgi:hypothetical protein